MSWLAGSYSFCSALWHCKVQNGNVRAESTTISVAETSGNKVIPFSSVAQRKDKELDTKTHNILYTDGWKGERGSRRLVIIHYCSSRLFLHWSQPCTTASHLQQEMKTENNRQRGRGQSGEQQMLESSCWLCHWPDLWPEETCQGFVILCLTWGALMKLCCQVLFTLWTGFSKGL